MHPDYYKRGHIPSRDVEPYPEKCKESSRERGCQSHLVAQWAADSLLPALGSQTWALSLL